MELHELQQAIINKNIIETWGKILIFTGDESYLQDIYLKKIAQVYEGKIVFGDDYASIKEDLIAGVSFEGFKEIVLRDSKEFINKEDILQQISKSIVPNRLLILIFTKVDARKTFFKTHQNITCCFEKMTENQLVKIIEKKYAMSEYNKKFLCQIVSNDYGRLLLELDKIEMLAHNNNINMDKAFIYAIQKGAIYRENSDTSFQLVDAMLNKDITKCFEYSEELQEFVGDPFRFLGLLYSNYKNLLLLKSNGNVNISYFIKKKLAPYINKFTVGELMANLSFILDVEEGIKSGKYESKKALDLIIIMTVKGVRL